MPRRVGHGRCSHGHTGMTGVGLLDGVSSQESNGIYGQIGKRGRGGVVGHFQRRERVGVRKVVSKVDRKLQQRLPRNVHRGNLSRCFKRSVPMLQQYYPYQESPDTSAAISSFMQTRDLDALATTRPLIMTLGVPLMPASAMRARRAMIMGWF